MKECRAESRNLALEASVRAYDRLNASFEALPSYLRQDLARQIDQELARDLQANPLPALRRNELAFMTRAVVCSRLSDSPELQESSQTFLRSRVKYLSLGGKLGRL